ncbi:uncharacterized protein LOC116614861 [Nematostella vectensis]|uniref:uncharacterized protein LOC116614861 n=1 Tax=Nematostella vectensis TaxID=45351 RepID=UPI001390358C|nr:uncharacterized protein LOC116614861 [Nematostella vectensis]
MKRVPNVQERCINSKALRKANVVNSREDQLLEKHKARLDRELTLMQTHIRASTNLFNLKKEKLVQLATDGSTNPTRIKRQRSYSIHTLQPRKCLDEVAEVYNVRASRSSECMTHLEDEVTVNCDGDMRQKRLTPLTQTELPKMETQSTARNRAVSFEDVDREFPLEMMERLRRNMPLGAQSSIRSCPITSLSSEVKSAKNELIPPRKTLGVLRGQRRASVPNIKIHTAPINPGHARQSQWARPANSSFPSRSLQDIQDGISFQTVKRRGSKGALPAIERSPALSSSLPKDQGSCLLEKSVETPSQYPPNTPTTEFQKDRLLEWKKERQIHSFSSTTLKARIRFVAAMSKFAHTTEDTTAWDEATKG